MCESAEISIARSSSRSPDAASYNARIPLCKKFLQSHAAAIRSGKRRVFRGHRDRPSAVSDADPSACGPDLVIEGLLGDDQARCDPHPESTRAAGGETFSSRTPNLPQT